MLDSLYERPRNSCMYIINIFLIVTNISTFVYVCVWREAILELWRNKIGKYIDDATLMKNKINFARLFKILAKKKNRLQIFKFPLHINSLAVFIKYQFSYFINF